MFQSNVPQITADGVQKAINEKKDAILLDVRTPEEYSRGKIDGSINISVENIPDQIVAAIPDKNKTIYTYCLSGSRSDVAVAMMKQLGYINVFSMTNGLLMWRSKKYPLA
ncbi:rhodanese-like domain-containing protein [Candidatus Microgenomates bacterium]|nr:MAG: rhodanese-like domain-containing protein [Candidatus Microgenomates bacterium]